MTKYSELSDERLKALADADDTDALYETAVRFKAAGNESEERKFLAFAAQLGHPDAAVALGAFFERDGDASKAAELYRKGLRGGNTDIAARLAALIMDEDEPGALDILVDSAMLGNEESISMLEKFYAQTGDEQEERFWKEKRSV
ncbi:MAG: hypothetical protein LBP26_04520 [Clostridiales bacterium]|jgi:TPR repeat protein|nr:hypothetical protein [Clostridiales bacterium]